MKMMKRVFFSFSVSGIGFPLHVMVDDHVVYNVTNSSLHYTCISQATSVK